ncbi:MAG: HAD family hydrolase, partial [Chloroflexota bacterium]
MPLDISENKPGNELPGLIKSKLRIDQIKAICFDVDGTLRDTDEEYAARIGKLLRPMRRVLPGQDVQKAARRITMTLDTPTNAIYTMLDWLTLDDELVRLMDWMQRFHLRKDKPDLPLIAGTINCLEQLSPHFKLAVVSARGEKGTHQFLEQWELHRFFGCVAHGQTASHTKPWPDPVLWAAEQLGVPPEECLMVGDTTVDIRAGRAAGAQTIGVLSGFGDEKELARVKSDLIIPSVADLPK